jgi:hypothetical protein
MEASGEGRPEQVWNIILSGFLQALEIVFFVVYMRRLRSLPHSDRAQDRRLWSYGLCILILLTATAVSNLIYQLLNRPH